MTRSTSRRQSPRNRELGRIHLLAAKLGLDTKDPHGAYRDMLWAQAKVESAAQLDGRGRAKVIAHLAALVDGAAGRRQAAYCERPHNADAYRRQALQKIEALLTDAQLPWSYARAIMARQTRGRKQALEFCDGAELSGIVAALEKAAIRRLHTELEREFGPGWATPAAEIATLGFGFDARRRDITRYTAAMSQALRWQRGQLAAVCAWPVANHRSCAACWHARRPS